MMEATPHKNTLIGMVREKRDVTIARTEHWYLKSALALWIVGALNPLNIEYFPTDDGLVQMPMFG